MRPLYGPIAPPPGQGGPASFSNNPFAALKIEERDEEDEDEVTWRGRGGQIGRIFEHKLRSLVFRSIKDSANILLDKRRKGGMGGQDGKGGTIGGWGGSRF